MYLKILKKCKNAEMFYNIHLIFRKFQLNPFNQTSCLKAIHLKLTF